MTLATDPRPLQLRGKAAHRSASSADPTTVWPRSVKKHGDKAEHRRVLRDLIEQVATLPGTALFDAVEAGVPTGLVDIIASATGESVAQVMDLIGVSPSTFRRKEELNERLPDAAGHRVMGFLRVAATLHRLLNESGDQEQLRNFDVDGWLAHWMRVELPELDGKTPAQMLRNPEGQRAVEQVLERMRGGLPA